MARHVARELQRVLAGVAADCQRPCGYEVALVLPSELQVNGRRTVQLEADLGRRGPLLAAEGGGRRGETAERDRTRRGRHTRGVVGWLRVIDHAGNAGGVHDLPPADGDGDDANLGAAAVRELSDGADDGLTEGARSLARVG